MTSAPENPGTVRPARLQVEEVYKSFDLGPEKVQVLDRVSFEASAGEALVLMGPSGSGKSTLLHLIGALDRPDAGQVRVNEQDAWRLTERERAAFRNRTVGFVFQDHHLLPQYSVLENVLLPTLAFGNRQKTGRSYAIELLDRVGLSHRVDHRPAQLSGGERQRVAVARALINRPPLMLCDEPTGSLDQATGQAVANLLLELHAQENNILLVVTHSLEIAQLFERKLELREGQCYEV